VMNAILFVHKYVRTLKFNFKCLFKMLPSDMSWIEICHSANHFLFSKWSKIRFVCDSMSRV
jgi:hypothetical protein